MIFYTAIDEQGHTHWEKTQADARAVNKNFEQVDVPTDKAGLHTWLNATQARIDDLEAQLELREESEFGSVGRDEPPAPRPQPEPAPDTEIPDEDANLFDAQVLEQQVDALGMLGAEALEQFDGWTEITGISAAFARGVALLNVLASDQHQIAKLFLRDRLKKRRRFGG